MRRLLQSATKNKAQSKPQPPTRKQIRRRPRLTSWRESDYREIFLRIAANQHGFTYRIIERGKLLERGFGFASVKESWAEVETRAIAVGRAWVRENLTGDVRVRVRNDRVDLFDSQYSQVRRVA